MFLKQFEVSVPSMRLLLRIIFIQTCFQSGNEKRKLNCIHCSGTTHQERKAQKAREAEINDLYAQIGKLTTQNEWLKKNLVSELSVSEHRLLVDMNGSTLLVSVQASLLELNRSGLYYQPAPHSTEELYIKQLIDIIYIRYPMYGYRRICWYLNEKEHYLINHKAVLRHMQEMGTQAIYPRQNTSKPEPAKTDWLYLVAIIDWYSRFVLHWQLSDTMEIGFVLDTSHKALKISKPEIMNSDQGSHFTSPKFTQIFLDAGSKISMDHRGRAYDNIFAERLWRTVKYEDVYSNAYETPREARIGINNFMKFYNHKRPHSRLKHRTPETVYWDR